jgi:hypothetical protein
MGTPGGSVSGPARAVTRDHRGQRFGHVIGHQSPSSGSGGQQGSHLVRDEETGAAYSFGYADIVTEGMRTVRTGERVRFLPDPSHPGHARYVIRLDQPDITEYYR